MVAEPEKTLRNSSFTSLLHNTVLMGSTQIVQICFSLLKGKIVAIFVGLAGTGLSSIYWSATSWIQQLASLGLPMAAVKDIAKETDESKRNFLISLIKRFFFLAANLGTLLCFVLSPLLSLFSFTDYTHTFDFMILSALVWFSVMSAGELTILQGLNQVRPLYKATVTGSVIGVLLGLPLYWIFGMGGIVWALIIAAAATYFAQRYRLRKIIDRPMASLKELRANKILISGTLKSGMILFLGGIIAAIVNFTIISIVRALGGIDDVGSYQSAWNIICQISAVVFAAMAVDYFPKLSVAEGNNMNRLVENQIYIGVGLITPIMALLMIAAPLAVKMLLSQQFMVIIPLLRWFALAMVLKAVSYPLGFIALAKAKRKIYFYLEVVILNIINFMGLFLGFYFFGLIGLGIGLIVIYAIDIIIYFSVCARLFSLRLSRKLIFYIFSAVVYTAVMLHLSLCEPESLHPLIIAVWASCSFIFPAIIIKKMKEHASHS